MPSEKWQKKCMYIVYIGKCRYAIQEQKEVPAQCSGRDCRKFEKRCCVYVTADVSSCEQNLRESCAVSR
jgi:hypothetical protein